MLYCCCIVAVLLLYCFLIVTVLLLYRCCIVAVLLLYRCCIVAVLLLYCCCIVAVLLLYCCSIGSVAAGFFVAVSVSFPERRQRKPPNLPATSIAYCSCPLCVPSVVCVVCILLCSFVLPATRSYMSTRLRSMTTWSITSFLYSTFVSVEHS